MESMKDPMVALRARYFRQVVGAMDGMITHHGDCHVWGYRVCTCGLLHDLRTLEWEVALSIYPAFAKEIAGQDRTLRC